MPYKTTIRKLKLSFRYDAGIIDLQMRNIICVYIHSIVIINMDNIRHINMDK